MRQKRKCPQISTLTFTYFQEAMFHSKRGLYLFSHYSPCAALHAENPDFGRCGWRIPFNHLQSSVLSHPINFGLHVCLSSNYTAL